MRDFLDRNAAWIYAAILTVAGIGIVVDALMWLVEASRYSR